MSRLRLLPLLILAILLPGVDGATLRIEPGRGDDARVQIKPDGSAGITGDGGGVIRLHLTPDSPPEPGAHVLEFEFFSLGGCNKVSAEIPRPGGGEESRKLPDIDHSEAWTNYAAPLGEDVGPFKRLTLVLPLGKGSSLSLRQVRLRPAVANEFDVSDTSPITRHNELIEAYLGARPTARIDEVAISESEITIRLTAGADAGSTFLGELPIFRSLDDPKRFEFLRPIEVEAGESATITVPRFRDRLGRRYDRLTSRWQLVRLVDGERLAISHARYPDRFPVAHPDLPAVEPASKKGLGGWSDSRRPKGDLDRLGISAITVNMQLDALLAGSPGKRTTPFEWQGRTYHANLGALARHDATFLEAAKRDIVVSAVLLAGNPRRGKTAAHPIPAHSIAHPDVDPAGVFSMPDMDREEKVARYGAMLHLLATRYSRPDGKFGRIHHYIVHNEVDAGWTWTNCGDKPLAYFFDLYHRSMRLVDLIVRSQDPNARAFITLTHHWADPGNKRFYGSKFMMLELAKWTRCEGDFPWALAHHPYPASLRKPRTWEDKVTFSFDSDRITPRNIEVLDAWMRRPDMLDKHGRTRPVHLSENGFNSPDYTRKSLTDQAAGMAYAWKKIEPLETIRMWHYHNWIDNRREGGLRIGLRRYPDDKDEPHGEKPIFHLYRDLATPREDVACAPYLKVIGLKSWKDALHTGPIR